MSLILDRVIVTCYDVLFILYNWLITRYSSDTTSPMWEAEFSDLSKRLIDWLEEFPERWANVKDLMCHLDLSISQIISIK